MVVSKRDPASESLVLATDLDGTLIPLDGCARNAEDLIILGQRLREYGVELVYVTGRHFASVQVAIDQYQLPQPNWIICDVGTTIYQRHGSDEYVPLGAYAEHLSCVTDGRSINELDRQLSALDRLRRQEPEKQGTFKLSYYADADELDELRVVIERMLESRAAPYSIVQSVDPFNRDGLIDLLPRGVSKAYALRWWSRRMRISQETIVFAGDSGNDLAALTAGYRTIIVGNAHHSLVTLVRDSHRKSGWLDRLFVAEAHATSGVLAGCREFGLIADVPGL